MLMIIRLIRIVIVKEMAPTAVYCERKRIIMIMKTETAVFVVT